MKLRCLALAATLCVTSSHAAFRASYPCPNGKIVVGDSMEGMLSRCGAPTREWLGWDADPAITHYVWDFEFGNKYVSVTFTPDAVVASINVSGLSPKQ